MFSGYRWVAYFEVDGVMVENEVSGFDYDLAVAQVSLEHCIPKSIHNNVLKIETAFPDLHACIDKPYTID